jgi:transcriptional regulator with XRE-family HTH domain
MYDNTMKSVATISERLRGRRQDLGLTLSEIARRAGTSVATLSRYENGWSRFEVQTLRKLATALDSTLSVELHPIPKAKQLSAGVTNVVSQLARLFWDRPLAWNDLEDHPGWVLERVLEYGTLDDIQVLREFMGHRCFVERVSALARLSPRTASFWRQILEMEGIACTKKYSRNTAWIS